MLVFYFVTLDVFLKYLFDFPTIVLVLNSLHLHFECSHSDTNLRQNTNSSGIHLGELDGWVGMGELC